MIGNRKLIAFVFLLIFYAFIIFFISIFLIIKNEFNIEIANIFIPLGTGLAAIGALFFTGNAVEHFANRKGKEK
ncbi:MAG: hypothetical protein ACM3O3_05845 [Syntrophothermus sp.]